MGFFAFYNGIIYNDYLSISLDLFHSCFKPSKDEVTKVTIWEQKKNDCTYPFGLDPVWAVSKNSLTFINPYKMKVMKIIIKLVICYNRCYSYAFWYLDERSQFNLLQK